MKLLITKYPDVVRFARERYGITRVLQSFSSKMALPENTQLFGNLPIPVIADFLATRPDCRYYHLVIPMLSIYGTSYSALMARAYFQRFHVEALEEFEPTAQLAVNPLSFSGETP